ncbi:MAG: diadenylate cyclase CdaA [Solobacterium sp.]|nr:diadenylate cyclase CdaA [Solobacterium sp.]
MTNFNFTFENIRTITVMFLDIFIMWVVLYYAIKIVRSNSRTIQIFKGILLVIIVDAIAKFLGLKTLQYLTAIFINWGFLAVIIIFQPEIRSLLERLGKSNVFSRITTLTGNEKENLVDQIVTATMLLSQDQTGALISIEQSYSLDDYIATGTKMNSDVTAELLTSIFVTSTPLHDGAVIIQGDKIACASAYFPPTNLELPSRYGARHRAAIGISEITDAVTIVVSEETGAISITDGGKIFHVDKRQLRNYLLRVICGEETEVLSNQTGAAVEPPREVIIQEEKPQEPENTGVMSKLAIKKQEAIEKDEKIEVEEVVSNEGVYKKEEVVPEEKEEPSTIIIDDVKPQKEKKHKFGMFHFGKKEEDVMERLEEDAADIKLPKKKERKKPSYPEHKEVEEKIDTEEKAPVAPVEVPRVAQEEQGQYRMSAEDVRRLREANMKKLSNKQEEGTHQEEVVLPKEETPTEVEPEEKIYDTSKIDITKIVGLDKELDETLNMIDQLETKTSKKKGGDNA